MGTPPQPLTASGCVLVAPDKFKGSATAGEVAGHLAEGLRRAAPGVAVRTMPVADGGEGTVEAAVAAGFERRTVAVAGPLGDRVTADFALRGGTAVVEMAQASGLGLLSAARLAPLNAGTFGTGQLVAAALDAGARTVVLGVGGSASTDGGAGMLAALGARLLDAAGRDVAPGGGSLKDLACVEVGGLDARLTKVEIILASDVDNPLLGEYGAAAVYGPQKGADGAQVARLDVGLAGFAEALAEALGPVVRGAARASGAGAGGGIGFAALALGATRRSGIDVLLDVLGFEQAARGARLIITGEGALDVQTLRGKAAVGVARAARRHQVPVVAVCGRLQLDADQVHAAGFTAAYALADLEPDEQRCITQPAPLLRRMGEILAAQHLS